mgnify:CR=1 FL=1
MTGVTATDTCGNDITAKIVTVGRYTFDRQVLIILSMKLQMQLEAMMK